MGQTRTWHGLAGVAVLAILATGAVHGQATEPAAVVNGQPITWAEVQQLLKARTPLPVQPTDVQRRQMEAEALDSLIDERLMQQFMHQHAPAVTPQEIDKQIADLKASMKAKNIDFDAQLKERGLTEAQVREQMTDSLQKSRYVRAHVTEEEVRRYYEQNRDFFDRVVVKASHILMRVAPNAPEADRRAAREKLLSLRQQIVAGQLDFAEAAKKYSQCPSAKEGGDIGYFPRKFAVDEAFARAAFALKVGEVSDVVQTDYGLHLIKVTDRKQEGPASTYEKIKEFARETAEEEALEALLLQLRKEARIEKKLPTDQGTR